MSLPTKRLDIVYADGLDEDARNESAVEQIMAFGEKLVTAGERPWFEVWYPAPVTLLADQQRAWSIRQSVTFDAVEIVDGQITTLPPYSELEKTP